METGIPISEIKYEIFMPEIKVTKSNKKKGLAPRKKLMIESLIKNLGSVTDASKETGVPRKVHYEWLKKDPQYKEAIEEINERIDDIIEKAFLSLIIDKNPSAVIHGVKTRLWKRGYKEKTETENKNMNLNIDVELNKLVQTIRDGTGR